MNYIVMLQQEELTEKELDQVLQLLKQEESLFLTTDSSFDIAKYKEEIVENSLSEFEKDQIQNFKPTKKIVWTKEKNQSILYDGDLAVVSTSNDLTNKFKQKFLTTYLREKFNKFVEVKKLKRVINHNELEIHYQDYFQYDFPKHNILGYQKDSIVVKFK